MEARVPSPCHINRMCSPMITYEESLDETKAQLAKKRELLTVQQHTRSPFLVGSIEEVNQRISNLDAKLQGYTELVIESRASERTLPSRLSSAVGRHTYEKKEQDVRELNKFAGIYTIKQTFLPNSSERIKQISKISTAPKSNLETRRDDGKPKFIELHHYQGFKSKSLTPLPHGIHAREILVKAALAQPKLAKKPLYRPEFEKLFYSPMSQAILQDTYWWIFLDRFHINGVESKPKLFNRVAHNYVKLLNYSKHPVFKEVFFKEYENILSQAVYAAFCETFPDSYRQFNEKFKDYLCTIVFEWVVGTKPQPRIWLKWDFDGLEPKGIRQREELLAKANRHEKMELNFDLFENTMSHGESMSTLNQSVSSMSNLRYKKTRKYPKKTGSDDSTGSNNSVKSKAAKGKKVTTFKVDTTPRNCEFDLPATSRQTDEMQKPHEEKTKNPLSFRKTGKFEERDPMTPIREFDENLSVITDAKYSQAPSKKTQSVKESHPLGKGPTFVKTSFNIAGKSPLVTHFLKTQHLLEDMGSDVRVSRTELEALPPLDSKTYRDVVQESFKTCHTIKKQFNEHQKKCDEENKQIEARQHFIVNKFKGKEAALLAKPSEVKRLCDLLLLERKKDSDSLTAGSKQAFIEAIHAIE